MPANCAITPDWSVAGPTSGELSGVVISADGSTIIAGGDQLISLTADGRTRWTGWSATCLAVSSNGDYILSSKGQVVRLISSDGKLVWEMPIDITITDVAMTPNGSVIAATGGGKIRTMDISGTAIASNETMAINHMRVMPSGARVLFTTNKDVQLSDITLKSVWSDSNATQNLVAVAADGSSFVTATDNRVRMYNGTGGLLWEKKFSDGNAQALAYSGDGSTIVIGMDDTNVQVLRHNGMQLFTANATNWITSVAVSDDGNTIAAGSLDKKLYVYNHAGINLGTFTAKSPIKFNSVAVNRDGSLIVVVDGSAVFGFSRSSFMPVETTGESIDVPAMDTTEETTPSPEITVRKVPTRKTTIPTPYPSESETPESALPAAVPLAALLLLYFCRSKKR
jgi:WD40 repeat protein